MIGYKNLLCKTKSRNQGNGNIENECRIVKNEVNTEWSNLKKYYFSERWSETIKCAKKTMGFRKFTNEE